jgi:hypothetical protein
MWGETLATVQTWPNQRPGTIVKSIPLAECLQLSSAAADSVATGSEPVSVKEKKTCADFMRLVADSAGTGSEPVSVAVKTSADFMHSVADVAARGEPASSSGEPTSSSVEPVSVVANSDSPAGELQSQQTRVAEAAVILLEDFDNCDYSEDKKASSDDESETSRQCTDATASPRSDLGSDDTPAKKTSRQGTDATASPKSALGSGGTLAKEACLALAGYHKMRGRPPPFFFDSRPIASLLYGYGPTASLL